jgi:3-phenylpropionate/trans-cinnamate dioxygenase ferredoxin reductase subunit
LSKTYLAGETGAEGLLIKPAATYEKAGTELLVPLKVQSVDRAAHRILLSDGREQHYDKLVLATGGRPRRLTLPGADASNILYLRTLDDIDAIRKEFRPDRRLVIVGGGYIGLEIASVAIKHGLNVTVLESAPRVLARVTSPKMSAFYERVHREAGVDLRTNVKLQGFEQVADRAVAALLDDGTRIDLDFVVAGIGLLPNVELAEAAGLEVTDGIVVDKYARSSDPDILAAGDCANHPSAWAGRRLRLESVPNAMEQARTVAATICGKLQPYNSVPWFWSDQYDLKLQMVGLCGGYDEVVVRGRPAENSFCMFYLRGGVIIAAETVNRSSEFMVAKRLVAQGVQARAEDLSDEEQPLLAMVAA